MPSAQTKFLLPVSLLQEMAALALHPVQAGPQLESLLRVLPHPHLSTSKCSGHLPGQPQSSLLPTSTPLTPNHCGHRSSLLTGLPIPHRLIHCPHSRRRVFLPANSSQTLVNCKLCTRASTASLAGPASPHPAQGAPSSLVFPCSSDRIATTAISLRP